MPFMADFPSSGPGLLCVPDLLRREIDKRLIGCQRIALEYQISERRFAKFDERKVGGQPGIYPEDADAHIEWCALKISDHWQRCKDDDGTPIVYRIWCHGVGIDGKRRRPSVTYAYSGIDDSVVSDDDDNEADTPPIYDPLKTCQAMLAQTQLRLDDSHKKLVDLSTAMTAHVEPIQALLTFGIQMVGAGMQMMYTGTQTIAAHNQHIQEAEAAERRFNKLLDFARKPFNVAAKMGMAWAARRFGGFGNSKDEDTNAEEEAQPQDPQQAWSSSYQPPTNPVESHEPQSPPQPTQADAENPLCAMAAAVKSTIRPTQWPEFQRTLGKRNFQAFAALFEADNDVALLNAWQHAKDSVPIEVSIKLFGQLTEPQQSLLTQAGAKFDEVLEIIEARRKEHA